MKKVSIGFLAGLAIVLLLAASPRIEGNRLMIEAMAALVSQKASSGVESVDHGVGTWSNGAVDVVFSTPFKSAPDCFCNQIKGGVPNACGTQPDGGTQSMKFTSPDGGSDKFYWHCIGPQY